MDRSRDAEEISEGLASIRVKLARMREESRTSLARLSQTLADADERVASTRPPDEQPPPSPPPAP